MIYNSYSIHCVYYVTASTDVQVSVLEVAEPERLETVVDGETGLDAIDERLQALLHQRHLVRQRHVFDDLTANNTHTCTRMCLHVHL